MRCGWPSIVFLCVLCLALGACAGKSNDHSAANPPVGDDDTSPGTPPPTDPWNHDHPRPMVTITAPQPGVFVAGSSVKTTGTVTGAEVSAVTINSQTYPVSGGAFTADLTIPEGQVVFPIYVTAAPAASDTVEPLGAARVVVFRGAMQAPDQTIPGAASIALGDDSLAVINGLLGKALTGLDLMALFDKINPIINIAGVRIDVTAASIGTADGEGEFIDTGMGFKGALTDVKFGLKITTNNGTPISMLTTVGEFDWHGLVDLAVDNGHATASVSDLAITHADVAFSGPLPNIIGGPLVSLLLTGVEDVVKLAINGLLPPLLEKILGALSIDTVQVGWDLRLALTELQVAAGALVAGLDLDVFVVDPDPSLPWPNGSLLFPGAGPDLAKDRPAAADKFGLGASLSENFLNRLLLAAADSKLFNLAVGGSGGQGTTIPIALTAGSLSLFFPSLGTVDPTTPISMVFTPMTPPVALATADGSLTLHFPDWRMDLFLDPPGHAPWRSMEISFDIVFGVEAQAQGGKLALSFPTSSFDFHFIDNPLNDDASLVSLVVEWLPGLLQGVLNVVFQLIPIGLPAIDGVTLDALWWGAAGEDLDYWTFYFGMAYKPAA